jgi:hypothetical protein
MTDSKPVKQEVNSTVILPPLVFPAKNYRVRRCLAFSALSNFMGVRKVKRPVSREKRRFIEIRVDCNREQTRIATALHALDL